MFSTEHLRLLHAERERQISELLRTRSLLRARRSEQRAPDHPSPASRQRDR